MSARRLLYIEASPLKGRSHTIAVANAFLSAYRSRHPHDPIDTIDLWQALLPAFDGATIEAKFAVLRRQEFTAEQQERWSRVVAVARRFNAADKYVFGVPMWNFSIPYPLKHYIDVVTLAGENWMWSKGEGYRSLLSGKKALLIYSSANPYQTGEPAHAVDHQKPYLRTWLNFIGVHERHEINVAPTLADAAAVADARERAQAQAVQLAQEF